MTFIRKENYPDIPPETVEWLAEIGGRDIKKFDFYVKDIDMFYTAEYIKNTPLEVLQEKYKRFENIFKKWEGIMNLKAFITALVVSICTSIIVVCFFISKVGM